MDTILKYKHIDTIIWIGALIGDYALIALSFFIFNSIGWISFPLVLLLLGIAQHRISVLSHEGVHGSIHSNKTINDLMAQILCFWPLLSDLNTYRKFHLNHHRFLGKPDKDPEVEAKRENYHFPITRSKLWLRFVADCCGASIKEFIRASKDFSKQDNPIWLISFLILSGILAFYFDAMAFWFIFLLSKPTTFWAVFRLRIYTEHTDTPGSHRVYLTAWQKFLFSPHHLGIHWEHHKYPNVPFWKLPALRKSLKDKPIITFNELLQFNAKE